MRVNRFEIGDNVFLNIPGIGVYPALVTGVPGTKGPHAGIWSDYEVEFTSKNQYIGLTRERYFESYLFENLFESTLHSAKMAIAGLQNELEGLEKSYRELKQQQEGVQV